jgi:hypothetical protein
MTQAMISLRRLGIETYTDLALVARSVGGFSP